MSDSDRCLEVDPEHGRRCSLPCGHKGNHTILPTKSIRGLYENLTIRDKSRSKAQSRVIGGMP